MIKHWQHSGTDSSTLRQSRQVSCCQPDHDELKEVESGGEVMIVEDW